MGQYIQSTDHDKEMVQVMQLVCENMDVKSTFCGHMNLV